jgi:hypothetical protein
MCVCVCVCVCVFGGGGAVTHTHIIEEMKNLVVHLPVARSLVFHQADICNNHLH